MTLKLFLLVCILNAVSVEISVEFHLLNLILCHFTTPKCLLVEWMEEYSEH